MRVHELHVLDPVRTPRGASGQHAGGDDQRHRAGAGADLLVHLLRLQSREERQENRGHRALGGSRFPRRYCRHHLRGVPQHYHQDSLCRDHLRYLQHYYHKVIKTKSVEYMPFFLSLANFANGAVWTAYGLIKFDKFIVVSNGLGTVLGAIQLIIYGCYYKSTPKKGSGDVIKPNEVQLSGATIA
ncbi:Bidirectional sugar transporter SWEET6b [Citrus sinensis]|uniref:Bidirectional sugar transporter SWEET6b n=1 Tax=Citrus sinensis TaxID=2711 RepID=A0ACB8MXK3_CITSI|nr:Bidirectional sugar transporter SWEET6b [Citrus sinensis]